MIEDRCIYNFKFEDEWFIPNPRSYFDGYSNQFNRHTIDVKLENLSVLIHNGLDLQKIISLYIDSHSESTLDSLKETLISYIQYLRWGEIIHWTDELFDEFSSLEIAETLQNELKLRYLSGVKELRFSQWGENIDIELVHRANKSCERLKEILMGTEFSKEFLNK